MPSPRISYEELQQKIDLLVIALQDNPLHQDKLKDLTKELRAALNAHPELPLTHRFHEALVTLENPINPEQVNYLQESLQSEKLAFESNVHNSFTMKDYSKAIHDLTELVPTFMNQDDPLLPCLLALAAGVDLNEDFTGRVRLLTDTHFVNSVALRINFLPPYNKAAIDRIANYYTSEFGATLIQTQAPAPQTLTYLHGNNLPTLSLAMSIKVLVEEFLPSVTREDLSQVLRQATYQRIVETNAHVAVFEIESKDEEQLQQIARSSGACCVCQ